MVFEQAGARYAPASATSKPNAKDALLLRRLWLLTVSEPDSDVSIKRNVHIVLYSDPQSGDRMSAEKVSKNRNRVEPGAHKTVS